MAESSFAKSIIHFRMTDNQIEILSALMHEALLINSVRVKEIEIPMKIDKSIWVLIDIGMATRLTVLPINILELNK